MIKPLDKLADELETAINKYHDRLEKLTPFITPKVCHCGRLITGENELIMMDKLGECANCDHVRGESYDYDEE